MSVIREVYSANSEAKEQYSVTRPETVIEMADRICEAVVGPTEYHMVALMNSVAEQLSDRGMALATEQPQVAANLLIAACEIGVAADKLDRSLIEKMAAWFEKEANCDARN